MILLGVPAYAQTTSCAPPNVCNAIVSGSTSGVAITAPAGGNDDVQPLNLTVSAEIFGAGGIVSQVAGPSGNAFDVQALALGPAGNNSAAGGNAEGVTVINSAQLSFAPSAGSVGYDNGYAISLFAQQVGGTGNGGGSVQGLTEIFNSGVILAGLPNFQTYGDYGILGLSQGADALGNGGGGSSAAGGVTVDNSAEVAITSNNAAVTGDDLASASAAAITEGGAGIAAVAVGGAGGDSGGTGAGGNAGIASVTDSAIVYGNYTGQGTSPDLSNGLYGILARSIGGAGGSENGQTGAVGGSAGAASVTLTAGADVYLYLNDGNAIAVPTSPDAGVSAVSIGGAGGQAVNGNGTSGNNGGQAGGVTINLTDASVMTAAQQNGALPAILAYAQGGVGGAVTGSDQNPSQNGGSGGNTSNATVDITAQALPVTISAQMTNGTDSPAVGVYVNGGDGGAGGYSHDSGASTSHGGNGGSGGTAGTAYATLRADQNIYVSTSGAMSPGLYVEDGGGNAAAGNAADTAFTGSADGGGGGNGGSSGGAGSAASPIALNGTSTSSGQISISTDGDSSPGVYVSSAGGAGGDGGGGTTAVGGSAYGGNAGNGGNGTAVYLSISYTSIMTAAASSPGIIAVSTGGGGGTGGALDIAVAGNSGNGGAGGNAGAVALTTDGNSAIVTQGTDSVGILAQSVSGGGGGAGSDNGIVANEGKAGGSGTTSDVTVLNGAGITTYGATARGILTQSMAGAGGSSTGYSWGLFHNGGGSGGSGSAAGTVTVTDTGNITTAQTNAEAILAQSIGGAGGAGGQVSGVIDNVGGEGGSGGAGGNVTVTDSSGNILTNGYSGIAVLAQSIGGNGGDGGGASGGATDIGGNGADAAAAATAMVTLNEGAKVTTTNDQADGVVVQSIGGGGGNGGNASAVEVFSSVALGGTGAGGGAGGQAWGTLNNASIITDGTKSSGLVVQSIGGGGGTGGDAEAYAIGVQASATVALGGSGGAASNATFATGSVVDSLIASGQNQWLASGTARGIPVCPGTVATPGSGSCNTLPVDDYGVVVQSIGGGGGLGGSATAESVSATLASGDTIPTPSVAFAGAFGGTGGTGGAGGQAQFQLSNGGAIVTAGQGSTAVLAQSIGGGGGAGGDSSAMATVLGYGSNGYPENTSNDGVTLTFGIVGKGAAGNNGGAVEVGLGGTWSSARNQATGINIFNPDPAGSAGTAVLTYGDFADGVDAQSIGGGGGNAGVGSGNTQGFGTSYSSSLSITIGEAGGTGADGGPVAVALYAPPGVGAVSTALSSTPLPVGITTFGSGSIGVLAQSVGGGGGSSTGSSFNVAQSFKSNPVTNQDTKPGVKYSIGGNGVTGGDGAAVDAVVQAPITTHGGDATGVLAQSIGGGGGLGGSAGSDASQDNPVVEALAGREFGSDLSTFLDGLQNSGNPVQQNYTFTMAVGGTGGSGGTGGNVGVDVDSTVTTGAPSLVNGQKMALGDWADGIVAQSVGGGGGKGGTAAASGTGGVPEITINLNHAIGGDGGTGGDAGNAAIVLGQADGSQAAGYATIITDGFGAAGVVAQSIGGGGGIGTDGSDDATGLVSVGGTNSGQSGGGGNGAQAQVVTENEYGASIATAGDNSDGVVVQSIGGGGGIGGAGSTAFVQNASAWSAADAQFAQQNKSTTALSLYVGGGSRSTGTGGAATFDSTNGPLSISTTGNGAFGLLVQSIGGGGGLLSAAATGTVAPVTNIGGVAGGDAASLSGGAVLVNLESTTGIVTSGVSSFGVVAQSIGSGGGVLRLADDDSTAAPVLSTGSSSDTSESGSGPGLGGAVTINMSGGSYVDVSGNGAIGIFAQSLDSGGGLIINGTSMYAGAPKPVSCDNDCTQSGDSVNMIEMQLSGPVGAFGVNGIGIFAQISGEAAATNQERADVVTYNNITGGSGPRAVGIWEDSPATNDIDYITVAYGAVTTENGVNGIAIENTGGTAIVAIDQGSVTGQIIGSNNLELQTPQAVWNATGYELGKVQNNGTVNVFGNLETGGDFTQTASGRLGIIIDSLNHNASHLQVDGNADVAGLIVPDAVSLLPGAIPIISANTLKLTAAGQDALLFSWNIAAAGNTANLSPLADFRPAGTQLSDSETSLADYLQRGWGNADTGLATEFANLSRIEDVAQYKQTLDAFSGKATEAQSIALINSAATILGAALSCPVYVDQGLRLSDNSCVWMKVTAQQSNQWANGDTQGYRVGSVTTRLGGEKEIGPDWYIGGAIAFGQTSSSEDGTAQGDSGGHGQTYDGSISLKHRNGPWLLAGSIAVADGEYQSDRVVNIPGVAVSLQGNPGVFLTGARFRAGYQFAFDKTYIQPYGDFDILYTNLRGFDEAGVAPYALHVRGTGKVTVAFSPMVEFGGRTDLNAKTVLRPFTVLGGSFVPDNSRSMTASLSGTSSADGVFHSELASPVATANFAAGVQLYRAGGLEMKAEYDAVIGGSYVSQSASARLAYDF